RRKRPELLAALLLKLIVHLEEIMEAEHEPIVGRAARTSWPEQAPRTFLHAGKPGGLEVAGQPGFLAKAGEQHRERVRGGPDARLAGIDVHEETEDAPAVGRPTGEGIDVQQVVTGLLAQAPGGFFLRTKADAIQLPTPRVARQRGGQPGRGLPREAR